MVEANRPAPQALVNGSVEAARALMCAAATVLPAEFAPLAQAGGRILAEDIAALRDHPPFASSAMDGWALRRADLGHGLRIAGESAAGAGFAGVIKPGDAVRIFTGAPVPDGADLVVKQEEADVENGLLKAAPEKPEKDNIRPRGGDVRAGEVVLSAGARLHPAALALAATAGHGGVFVRQRPRVALLATGAELVAPGTAPAWDQIFESNSLALAALVEAWGGEAFVLQPQKDSAEAIAASVGAALIDCDVAVVVGGASVGDHDRAKPALERLGLDLLVNKVKVRPGKPVWFGAVRGRVALGLPGNPASAFVCAHLFLKPLMAALLGQEIPETAPLRAQLAHELPAEGPRESFLRAQLAVQPEGTLSATVLDEQDSSLTRVLALANGLVRRPAGAPAAAAGAVVEALFFEGRPL